MSAGKCKEGGSSGSVADWAWTEGAVGSDCSTTALASVVCFLPREGIQVTQ